MAWPRARFKTAAAGGTWTPDDMNGWQDQFIRPNGLVADDLSPQLAASFGVNQTGVQRRDYDEELGEQSPTGRVLTSSPQVTVVADGLALVFVSLDVKLDSPGSSPWLEVGVFRSGGAQMGSSWSVRLEQSTDWQTMSPPHFIIIPASGPTTMELAVIVTGGGASPLVRNVRMWALTQSYP